FYMTILQDVLFVLTDSDHKAGFKTQCMLLSRMFNLVETHKISQPLYQPSDAAPGTSNKEYVSTFVANLLQRAFSGSGPAG
ncbi:MAG: Karyopherin transporter, partial [Watsoniomyces obsoletus]